MLRDEFAKAALTGLAGTRLMSYPEQCAKIAYELADAMVRQSKVPHKTAEELVKEFQAIKPQPAPAPVLPDTSWMDADELMVDPPSGWRYGFPKVWNKKTHPDMSQWLIDNGYPEKEVRKSGAGLICTFMALAVGEQK